MGLFRDINSIADVRLVGLVKVDFLLFRSHDCVCFLAVSIPVKKYLETSLHGPVILIQPAVFRQHEIPDKRIATLLQNLDFGKHKRGCPGATADIRNLQFFRPVEHSRTEDQFRLGVSARTLPMTLLVQINQEPVIIRAISLAMRLFEFDHQMLQALADLRSELLFSSLTEFIPMLVR